jgi:hypothetical protein
MLLFENEAPKAAGVSMAVLGESDTPTSTFILIFIIVAFGSVVLIVASKFKSKS